MTVSGVKQGCGMDEEYSTEQTTGNLLGVGRMTGCMAQEDSYRGMAISTKENGSMERLKAGASITITMAPLTQAHGKTIIRKESEPRSGSMGRSLEEIT